MEKRQQFLLIVFGVLLLHCGRQVRSGSEDHRYEVGDHVPLYVNKVGPFQNPRETYCYFDLPFCQPDYFKEKKQTLGEALNGDHLINAPYKLEFRVNKNYEVACRKNLTKEEVTQFRTAIERGYIFQMFYDDMPVWASIGRINTEIIDNTYYNKYVLYEHIHFDILFNKGRVVEIYVRKYPEALVDITEDKEVSVEFFYTVHWREVGKPFEKRMEKYLLSSFTRNVMEYHWFSIMNSCVGLLLLIGVFLKVYIRDIKKSFTREELASNQEERGWKYIQDDVFAYPGQKSLLAAALGSGAQLLTLTVLILILGLFGLFYPHNRGRLLTALVIAYAITSSIAGYTSTFIYCHLEGTNWLRNLLLTGCLFCGPLLFIFVLLNSIATSYKASVALSFGTVLELALIWTLIALPLLVLGGLCGKRTKPDFQAICQDSKAELQAALHVTKLPREIPPRQWYRRALPQLASAGFLPFSAMYCQLPIIINSIWGHGLCTIYNILSIVFLIVVLQITFISAAFTGKQLALEDPKWWWRSFLHGGSVGLYVYGYCLSYYFTESNWSSSLQISFFFGYMACICFGLFLMFGTVSFAASFFFVRRIYSSIKCD